MEKVHQRRQMMDHPYHTEKEVLCWAHFPGCSEIRLLLWEYSTLWERQKVLTQEEHRTERALQHVCGAAFRLQAGDGSMTAY